MLLTMWTGGWFWVGLMMLIAICTGTWFGLSKHGQVNNQGFYVPDGVSRPWPIPGRASQSGLKRSCAPTMRLSNARGNSGEGRQHGAVLPADHRAGPVSKRLASACQKHI